MNSQTKPKEPFVSLSLFLIISSINHWTSLSSSQFLYSSLPTKTIVDLSMGGLAGVCGGNNGGDRRLLGLGLLFTGSLSWGFWWLFVVGVCRKLANPTRPNPTRRVGSVIRAWWVGLQIFFFYSGLSWVWVIKLQTR